MDRHGLLQSKAESEIVGNLFDDANSVHEVSHGRKAVDLTIEAEQPSFVLRDHDYEGKP